MNERHKPSIADLELLLKDQSITLPNGVVVSVPYINVPSIRYELRQVESGHSQLRLVEGQRKVIIRDASLKHFTKAFYDCGAKVFLTVSNG